MDLSRQRKGCWAEVRAKRPRREGDVSLNA
jgi:hypothetical protein